MKVFVVTGRRIGYLGRNRTCPGILKKNELLLDRHDAHISLLLIPTIRETAVNRGFPCSPFPYIAGYS